VVEDYEFHQFRSNHCILCLKNLQIVYKQPKDNIIRLSHDGKKTSFCVEMEKYLSLSINNTTDFKVICKACYRSIGMALKVIGQKKESLAKGRAIISEQISDGRTKRELPTNVIVENTDSRRRRRFDTSYSDTATVTNMFQNIVKQEGGQAKSTSREEVGMVVRIMNESNPLRKYQYQYCLLIFL